jgi:hypothetical protein
MRHRLLHEAPQVGLDDDQRRLLNTPTFCISNVSRRSTLIVEAVEVRLVCSALAIATRTVRLEQHVVKRRSWPFAALSFI